jgi:acetolactate synthase-1/2/3 large subunit
MIRVDVDPVQSVGLGKPDVHIVTTAKKALGALADRVQRHNVSRPSRAEEYGAVKARVDREFDEHVKPQHDFSMAIRRVLPDDGFITFGVTQLGFYAWYNFPIYRPRTNIQPGYQGTLGYAFPTALGVQAANPSRKSVCVTGDGGFMFGVQELATAVQHKIGLVTIVFNDNAFGNVRRYQRTTFGGRFIASDLHNPDFMKLADSFGLRGYSTDNPGGLEAALEDAFKSDEPSLIEVTVGELPNPFPYFARKKVR